jgi:hypothetical protein
MMSAVEFPARARYDFKHLMLAMCALLRRSIRTFRTVDRASTGHAMDAYRWQIWMSDMQRGRAK